VDGLISFWELSQPLVARLAEQLGLPGNPPDAVDNARDKQVTTWNPPPPRGALGNSCIISLGGYLPHPLFWSLKHRAYTVGRWKPCASCMVLPCGLGFEISCTHVSSRAFAEHRGLALP